MEQIKIKIRDKTRLGEVAPFVDSPDLEKYIVQLRRKVGLNRKTVPYKDFESYWSFMLDYKLSLEERQKYEEMVSRLELLKMHGGDSEETEALEQDIKKWQDPRYNFLLEVKEILSKFNKGEEFEKVVIKATICGEIRDEDFNPEVKRKDVRNIERDREWYWSNRRQTTSMRLGYRKISRAEDEILRTVESGIKSYMKRLIKVHK